MSWESNPEVISTPMQQAKRQKYIVRRLGFLYHLTGSSAAIWVTMGSENPDALGTAFGITRGMCGAIVKTHTRSKLAWSTQVRQVFFSLFRDSEEDKGQRIEIQVSGDDSALN